MKRLVGVVAIVLVLAMGSTAMAKLSGGDKSKIKKWLAAYFDVSNPDDRGKAKADFIEYLSSKRKVKELANVEQFTVLLASAAVRPTPSSTRIDTKVWPLKEMGIDTRDKFSYVLSLPKKYSGSDRSDSWPLILCLPDKEQSAEDYMEKYWTNSDVRNEYVIIVLGFKYGEVEVTKQRTVEEEKGAAKVIRMEEYKEKVPFSWTIHPERVYALQRFWASLAKFQMLNYKIDPNRIILDGAGFGADGVLNYASGSAWRFAGVILRGGASESPNLSNLAHLPILSYPVDGASEAVTKTHTALKAALAKGYTTADATPDWSGAATEGGAKLLPWLGSCKRDRYPVPSKWVRTDPAERTGYWISINKTFVEEPAEASIKSDPRKGTIEVTTKNVAEFDLYLNDVLVNLDKEFELIVNGESRGKFTRDRSAEQLISHLMSNSPRDLGCVFTAEMIGITIEAPPAKEGEDGGEKKDDAGKKDGD